MKVKVGEYQLKDPIFFRAKIFEGFMSSPCIWSILKVLKVSGSFLQKVVLFKDIEDFIILLLMTTFER